MFGDLLSSVVKAVTLPIDVVEISLDVVSGGDGSKHSRRNSDMNIMSEIRDEVCETIKDIDK